MATRRTSAPHTVAPGSVEEQGIGPAPRQRLLTRAQFFDDPASYRAGMCEAFEWMARHRVPGGDRTRSSWAERRWSA